MAVGDARAFLKQATTDRRLRDQLNEAASRGAIAATLEARNMRFTHGELEEAYRSLLVQSRTAEEAAVVREIKSWWDFLMAATSK